MSNLAAEAPRDHSWAEYLHCMEGGSDVLTLPQAKTFPAAGNERVVFGLSAALVITVLAAYLAQLKLWPFTLANGTHPLEPVMLAIILGMVISNVWRLPKSFGAGIKFSVKKLLPVGIVFLGARLDFMAVVKVGMAGVALSILETAVALAVLIYLAGKMNLPRKLGLLLGIGTGICGGTAIVAAAPVIEAEEKDVVFSVATVTLLGLIAMFALPVLGTMMHMSQKAFGIWAGLAIHQTPQVVAAGFAYGNEAGDTATIVKLARVCLLAPVVFVVGLLHARSQAKSAGGPGRKSINYFHLFPLFVLGFLGMALLRTIGLMPALTFDFPNPAFFSAGRHAVGLEKLFEEISKYCIIISMAGVGLETQFSSMKQTGMKPFIASLVTALLIGVLILALIKALGI